MHEITNFTNGSVRAYFLIKHWFLRKFTNSDFVPNIVIEGSDRVWYKDNKPHREDGPAIVHPLDLREWWFEGKRHRIGGPATIWPINRKEWWVHGKLHREDGPAIEWCSGNKEWFVDGRRHRIDGPAVTTKYGCTEWWINGKWLTNEIENWYKEYGLNIGVPLSPEMKLMFELTFR